MHDFRVVHPVHILISDWAHTGQIPQCVLSSGFYTIHVSSEAHLLSKRTRGGLKLHASNSKEGIEVYVGSVGHGVKWDTVN